MVLETSVSSQTAGTRSHWQQLVTFLWERLLQPLLQGLFRWVTAKKAQPLADIPGPTPLFPLGNTLDFQQASTSAVLTRYGQQYGGIAKFWLLFRPCLALNDPDLIEQVMCDPVSDAQPDAKTTSKCPFHTAYKFYKDLPRKALRPMLTETSPFEAKLADQGWQDLKQNHPFSMSYFNDWLASQVEPLSTLIENRATELVADSEAGFLPAYDSIEKLTFDGFSLATVGQVFPKDVFDQFNGMCKTGTSRMVRSTFSDALIPEMPQDRTYQKISQAWFNRFEQIVQDAAQQPPADSLLAWVLREGGTNFDAEKLRNFCAGVYPGGAISTPSGITSALYLLAQNPETLPPLRSELQELFSEPLTWERLDACTGLEQVLRETLRLCPPVPFFLRNVHEAQDITLAGHTIPANTPIYVNSAYLHRDGQHWSNPNAFQPSRWDAQTLEENPWGSAYFFPFGRGERSCIGQGFARYFMKLSLAVLLSKFAVTFNEQPYTEDFFFAVSVPQQLQAKLSHRST